MPGTLPYKALDSVTATGAGAAKDWQDTKVSHLMQVVVTGAPTECDVRGEISLDGSNWIGVMVVNDPAGGYSNAGSALLPARYVRARVLALNGGTSPTVTAWIASA